MAAKRSIRRPLTAEFSPCSTDEPGSITVPVGARWGLVMRGRVHRLLGTTAVVSLLGAALLSAAASPTQAAASSSVSAGSLNAVAAISTRSPWAVGTHSPCNSPLYYPLIDHWNGSAWKQQTSSNITKATAIGGVAATSSSNAWAVGSVSDKPLIEHWNGKAWKSSQISGPFGFDAAAATSPSDAWAAGYARSSRGEFPAIVHWNGTAWKRHRRRPSTSVGVVGPGSSADWLRFRQRTRGSSMTQAVPRA
jgi:hypothetical protein